MHVLSSLHPLTEFSVIDLFRRTLLSTPRRVTGALNGRIDNHRGVWSHLLLPEITFELFLSLFDTFGT